MIRQGEYRSKASFTIPKESLSLLKRKVLQRLSGLRFAHFLDSHGFEDIYGRFEFLAAGSDHQGGGWSHLEDLESAFGNQPDWYFGHLCYEYKNQIEPSLPAAKPGRLGYPPCFFYRPQWLAYQLRGEEEIHLESLDLDPQELWSFLWDTPLVEEGLARPIPFLDGMDLPSYIDRVERIQNHLASGDCYELNFCVEARAKGPTAYPFLRWEDLGHRSPAPFSAYHKWDQLTMVGASPERYLCRRGDRVYAQPIKGTISRGKSKEEDDRNRRLLETSTKEQAENLMIVDLMRNDLSRFCIPGTVKVPELMGIHAFAQVFQMISTIEGQQSPQTSLMEPIECSFPMGSMTGAPKVEVMKIIDAFEPVSRELFSGTVGYIQPDGDFDFNVNIRSLFYDGRNGDWSYQTGGAITFDSDPKAEWDERRAKAWALESIFGLGRMK